MKYIIAQNNDKKISKIAINKVISNVKIDLYIEMKYKQKYPA